MRPLLRSGLMLILLAGSLAAQADKTDDYVKIQMQRRHIPGLSLAVIRNGKVIKARGYGLANVETNTPATPETVYKIGSISKQFFAAGILLLAEDGKLGLDDKISQYLDGTPETWKEMTIRHLLSHTSGLPEDPPVFEPYKFMSDADVVKSAYTTPLLFAPGEKWSYSNLGYFALAEVIHKVSGQPWSAFLTQRLFAPADMTATRVTTAIDIVPERASGYGLHMNQLVNAENWIAVRPSGAFLSTVRDMAKWDAALSSDTLLKASVREQMWTPVKLNDGTTHAYGFGWFLDPWQGHQRVYHQGGLPGFLSDFERFVDDKLTVIVLFNSTSADPKKIALNVAGFYVPALAPPVPKPIPDTEPEITAQIKSVISDLIEGHVDMSRFAPAMSSYMTPERVAGMSNTLRSPGVIQSITLIERKVGGDDRAYTYRVIYRKESYLFICVLNKENRISGIGLDLE